MFYKFRFHLTFLSLAFVFCRLLLPFLQTNNQGYTIKDFGEDMNMFCGHVGISAQMRGDFARAIKFYKDALKYRPDDSECLKNLNFCLKKIKKSLNTR